MSSPTYRSKLRALETMLLTALADAGINGVELLTAGINDFRPLTWMAPPIYPLTEIGEALPTVFAGTKAFRVIPELALAEYHRAMIYLKESAYEVLSEDLSCLPRLGSAFGLEPEDTRAVFSGPMVDNFKAAPEAGFTLSLEMAAALYASGVEPLIKDANNFYVVMRDGSKIGVVKGKPSGYEDRWPTDFTGDVEVYLSMQRGAGWTEESLDVIDRIYFWAESNYDKLEVLGGLHEVLPYLKSGLSNYDKWKLEQDILAVKPRKPGPIEVKITPQAVFDRVRQAQEVMADIRIPDQDKIATLVELLVPTVVSESTFNSKFWNLSKPVFTMDRKSVLKIERALERINNKGTMQ